MPAKHPLIAVGSVALMLSLGACAPDRGPEVEAADAAPAAAVETPAPAPRAVVAEQPAPAPAPVVCATCGVVSSITAVQQEGRGTGIGAVAGAVVGGVVGNQVGGGSGRKIATAAG
ncbi:MAG: glycine zipper 2TM domain-containing protein, partial [Gammaproteobacteria bacterium]